MLVKGATGNTLRDFTHGLQFYSTSSMRQIIKYLTCLLHYILSLIVYTFWENREFVFISIVQLMMSANSRILFGLQIVFVCLYITPSHYHHCTNFIWRHWTYEMPVRYNLSSVWVRLNIFSQLSIMWGCVFSVYPFPLWWSRDYTYFVLLSS